MCIVVGWEHKFMPRPELGPLPLWAERPKYCSQSKLPLMTNYPVPIMCPRQLPRLTYVDEHLSNHHFIGFQLWIWSPQCQGKPYLADQANWTIQWLSLLVPCCQNAELQHSAVKLDIRDCLKRKPLLGPEPSCKSELLGSSWTIWLIGGSTERLEIAWRKKDPDQAQKGKFSVIVWADCLLAEGEQGLSPINLLRIFRFSMGWIIHFALDSKQV